MYQAIQGTAHVYLSASINFSGAAGLLPTKLFGTVAVLSRNGSSSSLLAVGEGGGIGVVATTSVDEGAGRCCWDDLTDTHLSGLGCVARFQVVASINRTRIKLSKIAFRRKQPVNRELVLLSQYTTLS